MEDILQRLCARVPDCIGAVLCDFEGESVFTSLGRTPVPQEAELHARDHVPKEMGLDIPVAEFLIRLAGAEPCALLMMFAERSERAQAGSLEGLEMCYRQVQLFVGRLPEDFYLVLVTGRKGIPSVARRHLTIACDLLVEHLL